jgi:uncharacterized membrane protein YraQ (UPF0718 family)
VPLIDFIPSIAGNVLSTVTATWPYVVLGVITAAALKVYVGTDRIAALFRRRTGIAVGGSVATAVATPFCSCGTTAVVLSMLATAVPWAPVVAFMVASPLTSPDELILSAGFFGWPFATYFMAASVILGLVGGAVAYLAERRGLLHGQARFAEATPTTTPRRLPVVAGVGPGAAHVSEFPPPDPWRVRAFARELLALGPRMVVLFLGFTVVGYTAVALIPTGWLTSLLGGSGPLSIAFAATLGLPFYFSTEASLPLIASFVDNGMSEGAAMAFLITGAGTSIGAIAGALVIARWRVVAIVIGTLWVGAILLGSVAGFVL